MVMLISLSLQTQAYSFRAIALVIAGVQLPAQPAFAAQRWFLMSRHGDCFPISSLERKFPDIGNIAAPDAFVRFVRAKGLAVSTKPMPVASGAAVEVHVPGKELALAFVTAELCSSAGTR
jgi:hypothetical protein